jgi:hypothetical protein
MRKTLTLLCILALLSCKNTTKNSIETLRMETVAEQLPLSETQKILFTLAADSMKGRDSKNGGYAKAADFVTAYFKSITSAPFILHIEILCLQMASFLLT